jgi:branched-chain amino acid transport system permease protein
MTELMQHLVDAFSFGSYYALLALGIALIFGVMGLINFAHGELIMGGAFVLVLVTGAPLAVLLLLTLIVTIVLALLMERVAFRPVRGADPATLLVTSFAVSYLLQNLAMLIWGSLPRTVDVSSSLAGAVNIGGVSISKIDLAVVVTTLSVLIALSQFLRRSALGTQMRAAAEDFQMARLLGVPANKVIAVAFGLSGLLAGIASIAIVVKTGTVTPTVGVSAALFGFIAVILGGMGSLPGAVLGGYLLGALTVLLQVALPLSLRPYRDTFLFLIVIGVLVWRPNGLIVSRSRATRV